jgi:hypothetical protein
LHPLNSLRETREFCPVFSGAFAAPLAAFEAVEGLLTLCAVWKWEVVFRALSFVFCRCVARGFTIDSVLWKQSTKYKVTRMLTLVRG